MLFENDNSLRLYNFAREIGTYVYIREVDFRGEEDTDDGVGSLAGVNNDAFCETTDWGHWSECSSTCGVGMKLRTRRFKDRMGRKRCPHVSLVEKVKCMEPPCSPGLEEQIDPTCKVFFTRMFHSYSPLHCSKDFSILCSGNGGNSFRR